MRDFIDDRTDAEKAVHWQQAAAYTAASARTNFDAGWHLLACEQQEYAAGFYKLARKLMKLE